MHKQGSITRWNAERGFGFIRSPDTAADVFFHAKDFRGAPAPVDGMRVAYEEIHVGGKGPRAMAVRPVSANTRAGTPSGRLPHTAGVHTPKRPVATSRGHASAPRQRQNQGAEPSHTAAAGAPWAMALMLAWAGLLIWACWTHRFAPWLIAVALALNVVTFLVYAQDKRAAQSGGWRTSEKHLHSLALLGGWPAAWWAQQWLRHKSRKQEFRVLYWMTVIVHCAALAALLFWPPLQALRF